MDEARAEERGLVLGEYVDAETLAALRQMADRYRTFRDAIEARETAVHVAREASPSILARMTDQPIFLIAAFAYGVIVGITIYEQVHR